jgi:hypothetical protein
MTETSIADSSGNLLVCLTLRGWRHIQNLCGFSTPTAMGQSFIIVLAKGGRSLSLPRPLKKKQLFVIILKSVQKAPQLVIISLCRYANACTETNEIAIVWRSWV